MNDDDQEVPGSDSTGDAPIVIETGGPTPDPTGQSADSGSDDGVDPTTGSVDDSTGSTDGPGQESSTTSTVFEDTSTGEAALSIEELGPGDLVVTEVMTNPYCSQDDCEWIEILNATDMPVNLIDLYIQDTDYNAGNQGRVTRDLVVGPGDVAVIARGVSYWNYDFDPDAIYGPNPGLNNGSPDRVVLLNSTEILDETALLYDGEQGVAWSLSGNYLDAVSNDSGNYWCGAVDLLPATPTDEWGSPGVINPPC
ncbi:MAG: lamin tail domain-containing protein [Myxococcota bacterium]